MPREPSHVLLERDAELARIEAAIEELRDGRGGMLVIEGDPGIGKTALLDAARDLAAGAGIRTLDARARELEREFAFGVVRQLLDPPLRAASTAERADLLEGSAAHGAAALDIAEPGAVSAADPGFAVLNGLYHLLANLADEALLLLTIDDAHWADPTSLRFLGFLAARVADLPALVVVAARSGDWEASEVLAATASDPGSRPLEPAALSAEATAEIVAARFGDAARGQLAPACHAATAGNPFYLHALLDELRRKGIAPTKAAASEVASSSPRAVASALVARLGNLSEPARAVVRALAVLGDGSEPELVAGLAGLDRAELARAADELVRTAILADVGELRFAHAITRNAVYAGIGRDRRHELHRRAASLLGAHGAPAERVAAQLVAVPPAAETETVTVLRSAAADAIRRGSVDSATAYLGRALAEPPGERDHPNVLFELGLAESVTDVPAAVDHLRESLELSAEPRSCALIASLLARTLFFADRTADAVAAAQPALEWLDPVRDAELRLQLQALILASACMEPGLGELAAELASRGRAESGDSFGAKALAAGGLYVDARAGIAAEVAIARATAALEGDVLRKQDNGRPAAMTAVMVLSLSDSDIGLPELDAGIALARERGDTFAIAGNMIFRCQARLVRGELAEAVADGEAGLAAGEASGIAAALPWGCGFLASAQLERGELDAAEATLARATGAGEVPGTANWDQFLDTGAELLVRRGEHRRALEATLELGRRFESVGGRNPAFVPWRSRAARCLAELEEDLGRARGLAAEEVDLARVWGAPRALGAALRAQALVVGGDRRVDLLREAVATLDGSPARLELARALVDLGAAVARDQDPAEARRLLDGGVRLARRCGAVPLVERAYAALELTGARPRRIVDTGVDALTPSERRVAELAVSGLTNREIAEQLFVTVKTVEFHLAGAYRKLDIRTRAELGPALEPSRAEAA